MIKRITIFICLLGAASPVFSQYEESVLNLEPQAGIWFGPVAPIPGTPLADVLDTYLGGGFFGRINTPLTNLRLEAGISYQEFQSSDVNFLTMMPAHIGLSYRLPFHFPIKFALRAGGGAAYVMNEPDGNSNLLPLINSGFELFFPAGRVAAIGLRIDYNLVYEKHLEAPPENPDFELINGHFLSFGLTLTFNLNPE